MLANRTKDEEVRDILRSNPLYCYPGLIVKDAGIIKGLGLFYTGRQPIPAGTFICQYGGTYRNVKPQDADQCIYLFFVKHGTRKLWDANNENNPNNTVARFMNHSIKHANVAALTFQMDRKKHICFYAKHDIMPFSELLYDYGDRRRIRGLEWLHNS